MKYCFLLVFFLLFCCKQEVQKHVLEPVITENYKSPDELLGNLFQEVQLAAVFKDSKTFVDCEATVAYDSIVKAYQYFKNQSDFNLKDFVSSYFVLPQSDFKAFSSDTSLSAAAHINTLWPVLTHPGKTINPYNSLLELPYAYVVPGGRFREVYYWDSFFTMLGLVENENFELVEAMLDNFAYLIKTTGHIPNGNRSYYLSRSQPPFFAQMIELLVQYKGASVYQKYKEALRTEYEFWMRCDTIYTASEHVVKTNYGKMNRYYDALNSPRQESYKEDFELAEIHKNDTLLCRQLRAGAESGWDYSSRWFSDTQSLETIETLNIIPVDLNALMYGMEGVLIRCYTNSDPEFTERLKESRNQRMAFLNELSYNKTLGVFEDYNWKTKEQTGRLSLAMVYPLYFKMASEIQAEQTARYLENYFLKAGGLVSTNVYSGQQWDAPNGWAPLQYLAVVGLENYGYNKLADTIMTRWANLNDKVYATTGKFMEKYNVEDLSLEAGGGEYDLQDGFGWTNGVYLAFKRKLENNTEH
ncbi:trehalase family glycosidase [Formosa sp. S-31]|uniref:trehalase family glycosidase n=1 Tax=Formosa sp. S-31 TaxID=2790949 RepID=UPI003EBA47B2